MSTSPQEELLNQIRAGWRVIALETCEEDRALAVLERVARACETTCMPWSLASGMAKHPESAGSLDAGLRAHLVRRKGLLGRRGAGGQHGERENRGEFEGRLHLASSP